MTHIFPSPPPAPAPPTLQPPTPMPDPYNPAVMEAQRKATQDILSRAGRASTILTTAASRTNPPVSNAGAPYSAKTLGGS